MKAKYMWGHERALWNEARNTKFASWMCYEISRPCFSGCCMSFTEILKLSNKDITFRVIGCTQDSVQHSNSFCDL